MRAYLPEDRAQLKTFTCSTPGERWTKPPQRALRNAADEVEGNDDLNVLVAARRTNGVLLGAVAFGYDDGEPVIHALGVIRLRRREGIGTELKKAALAWFVADGEERVVHSQVHKKNFPMQGLNSRLHAGSTKDPDDGDYLLTSVLVVPVQDQSPAWHRAAALVGRISRALPPFRWVTER